MAINWEISIINVNVQTGRATVTATRTDTNSTLAPSVYSFTACPIKTSAERTSLLNTIKQKVLEDATHAAEVDAVISGLEQDGKSALEAWEATR